MKEERLEVRRRHGPTRLEKLRWHVGSIVAAALAVLLILQIAGRIAPPNRHAVAAVGDLEASVAKVREEVAARRFPSDEREKLVDEEIGRLVTTFKHHPSPAASPPSLTYPAAYLDTLQPGESNEIRFDAPIDLTATAEAGGVALAWGETAESNVKAGGFEVFRKEGAGEPEAIGTAEGATRAWRDTTAKPGHVYEYTVRAVAADPDIADTPRGRSPFSAPATAKAIADFKIEIVGSGEGVAKLRVSKWIDGAWRDRVFDVREGEAVGTMDQALGIDFGTGRTLAKLATRSEEVPVNRREIVFDEQGKVVIEAGAPKTVAVSGVERRITTVASITGGSLPDEVLELPSDSSP